MLYLKTVSKTNRKKITVLKEVMVFTNKDLIKVLLNGCDLSKCLLNIFGQICRFPGLLPTMLREKFSSVDG